MGEIPTLQQLRDNSFRLAIRSTIQAIQSTLISQEILLQRPHVDIIEIESTIISQNKTLQHLNQTLADLTTRFSFYQQPPPPTPLSAAAPGSTALVPPSVKSHALNDSFAAAPCPPSVRASLEQKKQPLFGAELNKPPSSFWGLDASQPPFIGTVGLQASFFGERANNMFDEMHKRNWASDEAILNLNTKAFADLDSPKRPDLELLFDDEISYHTFVGATNLKVMQLTTSILNQPTAALVDFGDTCNCLYPRIVILLGLEIERSAFSLIMKNGDKIKSKELNLNDCILFFLGERKIKAHERKKIIFDPGGILDRKIIFDLEDKVVFEGMVLIRVSTLRVQLSLDPREQITLPAKYGVGSKTVATNAKAAALKSLLFLCNIK